MGTKIEVIEKFKGKVKAGKPKNGDIIRITYDNGTVREKKYYDTVIEETPKVYLHIDITGGDGLDPIGILNNGIDTATVTASLRKSSDPTSKILTDVTGMRWRATIRDTSNIEYDMIKATFTDGVFTVDYKTTGRPSTIGIKGIDVTDTIDGAEIVLVGNPTIKVYRELT